ncbi:MAG TPA: metallophosphoesterase [Thermoanaerobaculia bacterium]|nr:metallophosphoesterase [Thermoanaerobaculia bacterium]
MSPQVSIPLDGLPEFDELHVISDLHLGGKTGFQIFNSGAEAQWLIDQLTAEPPKKRIALLINGDLVDFLAEENARYFDSENAVKKLERIAGDPAFAPVWQALQRFARKKGRRLIVNLGNHDVELALPWVRSRLLDLLSAGDEAALGRIFLTFDGAGYLCRVGNAAILCVHGNEVDDWNVTDHETIRRIGRDVVHGLPVESWIPNAGTQLVIEVMNGLKRRYPFIDLLKPEAQGVVPTLLALAPDQRDKLLAIAGTARRLVWDKIKRSTGLLGAEEGAPAGEPPARPMSAALAVDSRDQAEILLRDTEERLRRDVRPMALIDGDEQGSYLGGFTALKKLIQGQSTAEVLREALENLREDRSFEPGTEDDTYKSLDGRVGEEVDFVVAGHTHLERALKRKKGRGFYFNTGTWVRLIRLERHVLEDAEKFGLVFETFKQGTMAALDAFPGLILRRLTVASFQADGGKTRGELRHVEPGAGGLTLEPVAGSQFIRE